ncbi:MAG: DegT/DnrJ/EryC1/StrS aminotransferase family protein [Coriobacteriales bacterium]|nr:DegT/DnrJ/EryC1/StrS aminotransferase family protein [Coriobacteriales bacterium]
MKAETDTEKDEMMRVDFSPPDITEAEITAVAEVLRSGWITTGPQASALELELARWAGVGDDVAAVADCTTAPPRRAAVFSSGTAALECALRLLGIGPGDEVITTAYTFTATASVIYHVGATPVLIDCAPNSFEMDYVALKEAITPRTKVIIPVDIGGVMCDYYQVWGAINATSELFSPTSGTLQEAFDSVIMLADAAHSLGASRFGHASGSVADFTAFSFHAVKNVTTAEGGALVWKRHARLDDETVYRHLAQLRLHGQTKDALAKSALGGWEYDVALPGYKYNLTDVAAALGLAQLTRYPQMLTRRRELVDSYVKGLDGEKVQLLDHRNEGNGSSCHLLMLRLRGKSQTFRDLFIQKMAQRGVTTNVHYKPLPLLSAYRQRGFDIRAYPQALAQYQNELSLPLYSKLTDEQLAYVCASFDDVWDECAAAGV